ncbi:protein kinase [Sorangium sp. So ce295]|uniref:serine/threonine-protein kinase n=1 Tax=Sorangium sp. So ce295 TaxID=3133295 RepID=UPI003F621106
MQFRAAPGWSISNCTDLSSVRCIHCGSHHDLAVVVCPATGLVVAPADPPPSRAGARAGVAPSQPIHRPSANPSSRVAPPLLRWPAGVTPSSSVRGALAPGAEQRAFASRAPSSAMAGSRTPAWPGGRGVGPTSSGRSLLGHVIGDKYAVTAIIGEGGMGAVYEAEHLQIGRLVAVKVMHPRETQKREAISRLEHEARVAGRIGHPNICEVYDMGWLPDGSPYLVMERLHGETLAQRIERCGVVPPNELVDIMLQVLSALVTAHDRGIVHRDLKPENIFLSERAGMLPVAKLLDFGISQASGMAGVMTDLTRTGMVMGTPYYMAPEQARGDVELDRRLDLWAAGVILYEALTGQRPFVARNYNALLVQILTLWHRPVTELDPTIPPGLSRLVDRALAKARDERFQSAREFLEGLRRFKNQVPVSQKRRLERVAVQKVVDDHSCGGAVHRPSEPVAETNDGQSRDDESEDRPTIPSLSPLEAEAELSDDSEATVVDPPAFPEDITTVVQGEGRARGGDKS